MAATTATCTAVFAVSKQPLNEVGSGKTSSLFLGTNLIGSPLREQPLRSRVFSTRGKQIKAAAAVATPPMEEIKEVKNFYNPAAANLELSLMKSLGLASMGLADELNKEGACDTAIFPDTHMVIPRCAMIGNLTVEEFSHTKPFKVID